MRIYLSPSNQDNNAYAWGNTVESEQCNRIAEATKTALERNGFEVLKAPEGQLMNTSIAESNNWGADLHIPIHTNAGNGMAAGTEIFIYDDSARPLAQCIMNEITSITPDGINRRIAIDQGLAEINSTNATTIYIEVDFHDNPEIARWIVESTTTIGEHICKGICKYYGVSYNGTPIPQPAPISVEWIWDENAGKWCAKINDAWQYNWVLDNNNWYYLGKDGYMKTGWINDNGTWYYCKPDSGEMLTGWIWDNNYNAWYYLSPSTGAMVTGWIKDNGDSYYLKPDGKMASNEYIQDGGMTKYWLGEYGKWIP